MNGIAPYILGSSIVLLGFFLIIGLIYTLFYFFKARKQRKYFEEVHTELVPGMEVLFGGGIYGTVTKVGKERVIVKVKSGALLEVSRFAIQEVSK